MKKACFLQRKKKNPSQGERKKKDSLFRVNGQKEKLLSIDSGAIVVAFFSYSCAYERVQQEGEVGGPTKDTMRQFVIQAHARTHLGSREREKRP